MNVCLEKSSHGDISFGPIYAALAICLLALGRIAPYFQAILPMCPLYHLFGIPCPTCGSTRSLIFLSHGMIREAFLIQPLFFLAFGGLILWGASDLVLMLFDKRWQWTWGKREKIVLRWIVVGAVFLNWTYLVFTV